MTEVKLIHWRLDIFELNQKGLNLEIIDYTEILNFIDLDIEESEDVLSDTEFKDRLSKSIYNKACNGKEKGVLQYRTSHTLENF